MFSIRELFKLEREAEPYIAVENAKKKEEETTAAVFPEPGEPYGVKTPPSYERAELEELELTYISNAVVFNSINKIVQTIMSADHEIVAKSARVQKFFDKFVEHIGESGGDITWEELLETIFKHQCIYGQAFVENIFNKQGNRIVDWDILDPKKLDYAKDERGYPVLDIYGKPVGYVIKIPPTIDVPEHLIKSNEKVPEKVFLRANEYFIPPERIAHIKLYTVGDGLYPVGLIEPIYKISLKKLNVEEALANSIYRIGFPIRVVYYGDMNHEPTPEKMNEMLQKLRNLDYSQNMVLPHYAKLEISEPRHAEKMREHLEYFKEQEITGLGIPKPFATGLGEDTNRATLQSQSALFELTLKDIIKRTCTAIRKYMFRPICQLEGFREVPRIVWHNIGVDALNKKVERLVKLAKADLLDVDDELKEKIRKMENL